MSIEDRLFALAQQYAGQHGPAGLADQATMISQLSSQAPDLHAEIRALAAAVSGNAGTRIKAAGNADLEAQAIAGEIAAAQKLSMASVTPAVAVVRRLDVAAGAAPAPKPADAGWAGDSVIAGTGAAPAYAPPVAPPPPPVTPYNPSVAPPMAAPGPATAQKPIWQNKWAIGGAAAVAALLAYQNMRGPTPTPGPTGGPTPFGTETPMVNPTGGPILPPTNPTNVPVNPPPQGNGGPLPELAPPGGLLPTLLVKSQGQGFVVGFSYRGAAGLVVAPDGGWDRGPGTVALARDPRAQKPDSVGGGMFEKINSNQGPSRLMRVQWQQDNLGAGPMCVAFVGAGGQDVNPAGSRLCVLDGGCSQAVACGQLPSGGGQQQPGGQPGGMQPGGPQGGGLSGGGMQPGQ